VRRPAALLGLLVASSALAGSAVDFTTVGRHVPPITTSSTSTYSLAEVVRGEARSVAGSALYDATLKAGAPGVLARTLTRVGPGLAYTGAAYLTLEAVNYGLSSFLNELKREATGDSAVCLNNATAASTATITTSSPCEVVQTDSSSNPFSYANPLPDVVEQGSTRYFERQTPEQSAIASVTYAVSLFAGKYSISAYCDVNNPGGGPQTRLYGVSGGGYTSAGALMSALQSACVVTRKTPTPVPPQLWIEGGSLNGTPIPAHPGAKDLYSDALKKALSVPANSARPGNPWPGVTLVPTPTPNQLGPNLVDPAADFDGDTYSDAEEVARGSDPLEPASKPDLTRDTDGDGVPDGREDQMGSNPYDPASVPGETTTTTTRPNGDTVTTVTHPDGSTSETVVSVTDEPASADHPYGATKTTTTTTDKTPTGALKAPPVVRAELKDKPADKASCEAAGGTWGGTSCTPKADKPPEPPVANGCGDFSVARLLKFTGAYLKDLFVPCTPIAWGELATAVKDRFPFSISSAISGFTTGTSGDGNKGNPLPVKMGPFTLNWDFAAPFFLLIGSAFRVVAWFFFFRWLLDRVSGQVVLS
jgi:Bacterial TSP3 repeat